MRVRVEIILAEKDVEFAKSIDKDYREDCFMVSCGELYYLTGLDYPTYIRKCL